MPAQAVLAAGSAEVAHAPTSPGRQGNAAGTAGPAAAVATGAEPDLAPGGESTAASAVLGSTPAAGSLVPDVDAASRAARAAVIDRQGIQLVSLQDPAAFFGSLGASVWSQPYPLENLQRTLRSGSFVQALDRLRQDSEEKVVLEHTLTVSAAGVSLGFSLVYVLWLIRGGVLMGSYLSALPAWRLLDPLPVLARPDEEAEEGEQEDGEDDLQGPGRGGRDLLRGFG